MMKSINKKKIKKYLMRALKSGSMGEIIGFSLYKEDPIRLLAVELKHRKFR